MYDIKTAKHAPDNFFAGDFPIVKDFGKIKTGATVRARTPIVQGADGIEEAAASTVANVIGITADAPSGGVVVYYLTGEFFTQALTLPTGVTAANLKPALRKVGIFLKEVQNNG